MARANDEAAALLQELADLLSITGGEAYKVRAYEKAARAIGGHHEDVAGLGPDELKKIPNVGPAIAKKIQDYLTTGTIRQVEELRTEIPAGVRALTTIPTLGPKKAMAVYEQLGISSVPELAAAINEGRLRGLKGFGEKTEENILHGITLMQQAGDRVLIDVAMEAAEEIVAELSAVTGCRRGTYARAALQYFTGSKAHNIRTREIAVRAGLKLSEYGLFEAESEELIVSATEEEVYERLRLPWIPPTLREDGGEIQAAQRRELPALVTLDDLRGDLHSHTDLTDGLAPLDEMVAAAAERGLAYYAITDHAPNLYMQRMTDEKMLAQRERVRAMQERHPDMTLLHGTELNIDPDGGVDWPGDFLAGFDVCVASVHSHFTQSAADMTRRLIAACENPYVNIIGHPTARLIGKRSSVDADWDEVFKAAARTGTALEVDSFPDRLDLPADLIRRAKRFGVKFSIDTDAHAIRHHGNVRYGVGTAQRGWLTPDDVINTWPLDDLRAFLLKSRP